MRCRVRTASDRCLEAPAQRAIGSRIRARIGLDRVDLGRRWRTVDMDLTALTSRWRQPMRFCT